MTSRIGVAAISAALLLYIVVVVWLAVMFIRSAEWAGVVMGTALLALAPIGAWAMYREIAFGFAADRLGRVLDAEGGMPEAPEQLTPSGRLLKEDIEPLVAQYSTAAESAPHDWRARYRLGVVQDAAGRRKDARRSIREAIRLAKAA
jgi:hypothetical protein